MAGYLKNVIQSMKGREVCQTLPKHRGSCPWSGTLYHAQEVFNAIFFFMCIYLKVWSMIAVK